MSKWKDNGKLVTSTNGSGWAISKGGKGENIETHDTFRVNSDGKIEGHHTTITDTETGKSIRQKL